MTSYQYANNPATTLSGSVTAGATSISVTSAADFPTYAKFTIIVDSEIMLVTGVAGAVWTVERGYDDTVATSHTNNAPVTNILTVKSFLNAQHVDVRAFGVVGDGVTDDAAALQSAVDAASANAKLFIPQGMTLLLGSTVTISRSLHIVGHGATLKAGADGLDAWLAFSGVTGFSVRGVTFDDDSRGRTALDIGTSSLGTIEDCRFTGYSSTFGTSSTDSLLRISTSTDVRVRGCVFEDSGNADVNLNRCVTINDATCKRIFVTECTFRNVNQAVVVNGTDGMVIANNTFDTTSDNGIYVLSPCQDLAITGNYFKATEEAIVLKGTVAPNRLRNVRIIGNHFEASTNRDIAFEADVADVTISGNVFRNSPGGNIAKRDVGTCYNWSITGNVFAGAITFAAVYFVNIESLVFSGNDMRCTFANPTTFFFRVDGTATNVLMSGNLLDDTGSANAGRVRFATGTNTAVLKAGNHLVNTAHIEDSGAGTGAQGSGVTAHGAATPLTSATNTKLDMSTADQDNHGYLDSANDQIVIPNGMGQRWFMVSAKVSFPSMVGRRIMRIELNGSAIYLQDEPAITAAGLLGVTVGGPVFLADADALTVTAYQNSGSSQNVTLDRISLVAIP